MRTLRILALPCVFAIGAGMLLMQDVEIKSGTFLMKCSTAETVKSNPDFASLFGAIQADLKTRVETNQLAFGKNINVRADILKSSSSGKILNGIIVYVTESGSETAVVKGTFFPCKDPSQSKQEYDEKVYNDYLKALLERIRAFR